MHLILCLILFTKNLKKMKKTHYVLISMFVISVAALLFISPTRALSQKKIVMSYYSIPDDVAEVLRSSCASCHSAGGNGMAMSVWSLSSWDKYSTKKQAKKSKSICNAITNGSMPPSWVKQSNPDRIPSAAQTEIVCRWANSLKLK
jgi:hypothetical protein